MRSDISKLACFKTMVTEMAAHFLSPISAVVVEGELEF